MMTDRGTDLRKKVMGVDYGTTRIGISLSDPLQIIAQPYLTLSNRADTMTRLSEIVRSEDVGLIVVGMPLNLKGEKGKKAKEVEMFIDEVRKTVSVDVVHWDERFTTTIAHQTLLTMGTKRSERRHKKEMVDSMAAAILLQSFLDSRKRSIVCS